MVVFHAISSKKTSCLIPFWRGWEIQRLKGELLVYHTSLVFERRVAAPLQMVHQSHFGCLLHPHLHTIFSSERINEL